MTIDDQAKQSITEEEEILRGVFSSLSTQRAQARSRLRTEEERARELTSHLVAARRDEDKAMLASDEAVSHGLKDQKKGEVASIEKLLKKPYFARIELEEELDSGETKIIEYKLGFAANPECRIIDWRKAPISKLYYEYKEGEEYHEEILGRDRVGTVLLRTQVETNAERLVSIANRFGQFQWDASSGEWLSVGPSHRNKSSDAKLPEILSLITAEQFRAITEDAKTAILIQGVAGSGKTTVALHRLSWLLHEDNAGLDPKDCLFTVLSPSLKAYVENSLAAAGLVGVKVLTYHEWAVRTLLWVKQDSTFRFSRPATPCPHGIERVKRSLALLKAIDLFLDRQSDKSFRTRFEDLQSDLLTVLAHPQWILEADESHLIDAALIEETLARTRNNFKESMFDWSDDALLLRLYQKKVGAVLTEHQVLGRYRHIVADEVQDFSPVELATLMGSVHELSELTLVGDTSQNLDRTQSFPGWDKLRRHWNLEGDLSRFVSLEVSHRSTAPIMRLADHVQRKTVSRGGREGRVPIWFKCRDESQGIEATLSWLKKAQELYPSRLTAVIAADPKEAKFAFKMLEPSFGPLVRLGDQFSFSFEEGILVTDVRQVKGLEFFSVLVWNPTSNHYPQDDLGRNLLYVALTRAEENVCLVTWSRASEALPRFGSSSSLMRFVDLSEPEEMGR